MRSDCVKLLLKVISHILLLLKIAWILYISILSRFIKNPWHYKRFSHVEKKAYLKEFYIKLINNQNYIIDIPFNIAVKNPEDILYRTRVYHGLNVIMFLEKQRVSFKKSRSSTTHTIIYLSIYLMAKIEVFMYIYIVVF